jgi:uncharacterized membrane protein
MCRWLKQIGIEISTKSGWGSLLGSIFLWIAVESLKHRIIARFNEWQDDHKEKAMDSLKVLFPWFIDHPYAWVIVVVLVILIHAYWKSQHEHKEEEKEIHRQENQKAFVAEIVAQTIASLEPRPPADQVPEAAPISLRLEEPRIYLGIQEAAQQIFPDAQFIFD